MAPVSFEEFLPAKPNLVAKFALFSAAAGLMHAGSGYHRRHHLHLDLAFQVYPLTNLITFVLGLLLMYISMVAPSDSTTTGGKIMMWVTLFMSLVTFVLCSTLLICAI